MTQVGVGYPFERGIAGMQPRTVSPIGPGGGNVGGANIQNFRSFLVKLTLASGGATTPNNGSLFNVGAAGNCVSFFHSQARGQIGGPPDLYVWPFLYLKLNEPFDPGYGLDYLNYRDDPDKWIISLPDLDGTTGLNQRCNQIPPRTPLLTIRGIPFERLYFFQHPSTTTDAGLVTRMRVCVWTETNRDTVDVSGAY